MNIFAFVSLLSGVIIFSLGNYVIYKNKNRPINLIFMLFCILAGYLSYAESMLRQAADIETAYFWHKMMAIWPFSISLLFHFILIFTEKKRFFKNKPASYSLIYIPPLVISLLNLPAGLITGDPVREYWGWTYTIPNNSIVYIVILWATVLSFFSFYMCLRYYFRVTDSRKKRQVKYVFTGFLIFVVVNFVAAGMFPLLKIRVPESGNFANVLLSIFIVYAIRKYRLFTLTPETAAQNIISTMTDHLVLVNPDGKIASVNQSLLKHLGYKKNELIDKTTDTIFAEGEQDTIFNTAELNKTESAAEMFFKTKSGMSIPVSISRSIMIDESGNLQGIILIARDITERKQTERTIAWETAVNKAVTEMSHELLVSMSIENISHLVLKHSKKLTDSKFGYAGYIDPRTGYLVCPTMTREIWDKCRVDAKSFIFKEFKGLWGWVLKNRKSLITNTPKDDSRSSGIPEGHIPVNRFLSAPAMVGERLVGQIALANSDKDYTERDLRLVKSLADIYAIAIQRRQAEQQLYLQSSALESAANGIVITDREGSIIWANPAVTQLTGYTFEETVGQNPRVLKSGKHDELFYKNLWETILSGKIWHDDIINKRKDGSLYTEEMTITPVKDAAGGEITHFIAIKQDVTERRRMEENLLKAKEEAEIASRAKSVFLASMSHEVRTPLNHILGFAQLLETQSYGILNKKQMEYMKNIREGGEHLLALISDILDFSMIEAGKVKLESERFDLRETIMNIIQGISFRLKEKGLILEHRIGSDVPAVLIGDSVRVREILLNLLGNAVKFTEKGVIYLNVTKESIEMNRATLKFSITDTGIGIPGGKLEKIFESFTQSDSDTNRKFKGTGLGLSISKKLVALMGGSIGVKSKLGEGSTFYFSIPFLLPDEAEMALEESSKGKIVRTGADKILKVLVVEDDEINQKLIKTIMAESNIQAVFADNGHEAMDLYESNKFDLILMDLQMPVMNGYEATARIREMEKGESEHVPIIALTAKAIKGDRELSLEAGMDGHITKPINITHV